MGRVLVEMMSFTASGMPCSGPTGLARLSSMSARLRAPSAIERLPGMDLALARLDAVEAGLDEVARLQPLVGHAQDGLAGRQSVGRFRHAFFPLMLLRAMMADHLLER